LWRTARVRVWLANPIRSPTPTAIASVTSGRCSTSSDKRRIAVLPSLVISVPSLAASSPTLGDAAQYRGNDLAGSVGGLCRARRCVATDAFEPALESAQAALDLTEIGRDSARIGLMKHDDLHRICKSTTKPGDQVPASRSPLRSTPALELRRIVVAF
jgi:hypothetical protein